MNIGMQSNTSNYLVSDPKIIAAYQSALDELRHSFRSLTPCDCQQQHKTPANPFFLSADKNYAGASKKLMFFGQETKGWFICKNFPKSVDASDLLACHRKWHHGGVPLHQASLIKYAANRIKTAVKPHGCSGFIWNNIVKIGKQKDAGLPCKHLLAWQQEVCTQLIRKEVNDFFLPDAIVFFTGDRDKQLGSVFREIAIEQVSGEKVKDLAIIKSKDFPNIPAIRTKHPNALNRLGGEKRDQILDKIAKYIVANY